jgi:hypothetical protein
LSVYPSWSSSLSSYLPLFLTVSLIFYLNHMSKLCIFCCFFWYVNIGKSNFLSSESKY